MSSSSMLSSPNFLRNVLRVDALFLRCLRSAASGFSSGDGPVAEPA
jgi:hypothetical protein